VLIAYMDESGDSGQEGGSKTYTLGCVLVRDTAWPDTFGKLLGFGVSSEAGSASCCAMK
jgi:hypothetical protein